MSDLPEAIVVFGASGFIGRNLVRSLSGRVPLLVGVTSATADVHGCDRTVLASDLQALGPLPADTVVFHVGAYRYDAGRFDLAQSDIVRFNAELNALVFGFCADRGIREVRMASSVAVYPAALDVMDDAVPIDLNSPPHRGEAFYAWSKRWGEILADLYHDRFGINTVSFRLSNPYGPFDSITLAKAHVAPAFVMKALGSQEALEIRGDPSVLRDFTYVGDVTSVFERSLSWRGRHDQFNVCTGRPVTLQMLAETILAVAGIDKRIRSGAPGAFGPAKRLSTSASIQTELGMVFSALEDGLAPTIEWYRDAYADSDRNRSRR